MKLYEAFGESKTWGDWLSDPRCVVPERTIRTRMTEGWSLEKSMSLRPKGVQLYTAFGEDKTLVQWSDDIRCKVGIDTLRSRLKKGWSLEDAIIIPRQNTNGPVKAPEYKAFGESKTLKKWLADDRVKLSRRTIMRRFKQGQSFAEIVDQGDDRIRFYEAFGESKTLTEWTGDDRCIITAPNLLHDRINYKSFTVEQALETPKYSKVSILESQLADFIEEHIEIERSNRTLIRPKELDIYIPSKNIAIEFNGLYWHSEKQVGRNYHRDKYLACKEQGVRLIQVWEDDWKIRRSVVESMLLNRLGLSLSGRVGARKTEVDRNVPLAEGRIFLDTYHIQGFTSASYRYGLRHNGELIGLLSMKAISDEDAQWDLVRYATSVSVPGGFSRLLKAFRSDHEGAIKTFADLGLSDGNLYDRTGFEAVEVLAPDYRYVNPRLQVPIREHKFGYRKSRFETDPELIYRDDLTESQLAELNGLLRVYDTGKIKYILR